MRPLILCLERLDRIRQILRRVGGDASLRDLWRRWEIRDWEVEQAAKLGWVELYTRKPAGRGRPSRRAKLCGEENAKLPLPRRMIPKEISHRHHAFAMRAVFQATPRGIRQYGVPGTIFAYMTIYHPKSRKAAHSSCSRLLIIGTEADLVAGKYRSNANPTAIINSLHAIESRGLPVVFAENPVQAAALVERWAWWRCRAVLNIGNELLRHHD